MLAVAQRALHAVREGEPARIPLARPLRLATGMSIRWAVRYSTSIDAGLAVDDAELASALDELRKRRRQDEWKFLATGPCPGIPLKLGPLRHRWRHFDRTGDKCSSTPSPRAYERRCVIVMNGMTTRPGVTLGVLVSAHAESRQSGSRRASPVPPPMKGNWSIVRIRICARSRQLRN